MKRELLPYVLDSFTRLKAEADLVLVEGAGSASEVNLRALRHRQHGICARRRCAGGADRRHRPRRRDREPRRHQGGARSGGRGAGARLYRQQVSRRSEPVRRRQGGDRARDRLAGARLRSVLRRRAPAAGRGRAGARWGAAAKPAATLQIAVPILPQIANFDDLDPLEAEPTVELVRVHPGSALPGDADLVILPGSKTTIADLDCVAPGRLRHRHRRASCAAAARCSGSAAAIQMLGRTVADPDGVEGPAGTVEGLGLLDVETVLSSEKRLEAVHGHDRRRHPVRGLRDAHGRDPRARTARGRSPGSPTARPRARCRRTAA